MPARNILKQYLENGYYHIYNRGVEKRDIFLDEQDCKVFLHYLKLYLSPIEELEKLNLPVQLGFKKMIRMQRFIRQNLSKEIDLLSLALMPNHLHLLIKQYTKDGIKKLTQRLFTSYAMYFNRKYHRVGTLFQSTYKAVLIGSDEYLLHLTRYIHLNPRYSKSSINFINFSSYPYYLGDKNVSWIKPKEILIYFKSARKKELKDILSYQSFVEDYQSDVREAVGGLALEDDY